MRLRPTIGYKGGGYFYIQGVRVPRLLWRIAYRLLAPKSAR